MNGLARFDRFCVNGRSDQDITPDQVQQFQLPDPGRVYPGRSINGYHARAYARVNDERKLRSLPAAFTKLQKSCAVKWNERSASRIW